MIKIWGIVVTLFTILTAFVFVNETFAQTCSEGVYTCGIKEGNQCTSCDPIGGGVACNFSIGKCRPAQTNVCESIGKCECDLAGCSVQGGGGTSCGPGSANSCKGAGVGDACGDGGTCKNPPNCSCQGQASSTPTPAPTPSCTVNLTPNSPTVIIGDTRDFTASVSPSNGSVGSVNFTSSNTNRATVSPGSDSSNPYNSTATAVSPGTSTIRAGVIMGGVERCSDTATLTVPTPTCTVNVAPNPSTVSQSSTQSFTANVVPTNGTVTQVNFESSSTSVATVSPPSDSASAYTTNATAVSPGTSNIQARVIMNGSERCSDPTPAILTVTPPGPWWQVQDADVVTVGDLISKIPLTCSGSCSNLFILDGLGGFPGAAVYGGSTADFVDGTGTGTVSSTDWLANTSTASQKTFSYDYFEGLIASDVTFTEITSTSVDQTFLTSGVASKGYRWYRFDGTTNNLDLTVTGNVDLGNNKVVLLVKGANLNIDGRINVTDGSGTFVTIVEEDIVVDPSAGSGGGADLEGMYFSDGQFKTGAGTTQLHIRGAVAAYGGMVLERDLANNSLTPAEFFEYGLDQLLLFPPSLSVRKIRWKEVAP